MKRIVMMCVVLTAITASVAQAQATRTWVSGVGDDVNPCSRTAPCKTFAGAISKTAAGGEIDVLDPGGFGAVTITKSLTIDGIGSMSSVLISIGNAINVNAGSSDVVILRNLSLNGLGAASNGIRVTGAGSVYVENCTIQGFAFNGIYATAVNATLQVSDTTIKDSPNGQGVLISNGKGALNRVTINNASVGVLAGEGSTVSVKQGMVSNGYFAYCAVYTSSASLNLEDSVAIGNNYGIYAGSGATVRASNVSIFGSTSQGLATDGSSTIASYGNNRLGGNVVDGSFTTTITIR